MIESTLALGFRTSALSISSIAAIASCRSFLCNFEHLMIVSGCPSRAFHRFPSSTNGGISHHGEFWRGRLSKRHNVLKSRVQASAATPEEHSEPLELSNSRRKPCYHPFEEVGESVVPPQKDEARLTDAEMARTVVELNSKATLMFSGTVDEIHENIFWPGLPYVTNKHGDIYFEVHSNEDILQTLTADDNFVHVLIGLDNVELLTEMSLSGPSNMDIDIEEIVDESSDLDEDDDSEEDYDDDEEDWITLLEDEEDDLDSSEVLGDWAKLDTMRSCHPIHFAKKIAEVVSNRHLDWMDQPSNGLAIYGLLRPALIEEHSVIRKHIAGNRISNDDKINAVKVSEDNSEGLDMPNHQKHESGSRNSSKDDVIWTEGLDSDESLRTGTSFYKLEIINIQLVSAHGMQTTVEVNDFQQAQPDAIAHSAAKVISHLNAGGEKIVQALKSLCWRVKGIQAEPKSWPCVGIKEGLTAVVFLETKDKKKQRRDEREKRRKKEKMMAVTKEAAIIGVDSLGCDLRVCSGTQVQTLRFSFNTRATSECSAERQLHDLLFPSDHQHMANNWQEASQKKS